MKYPVGENELLAITEILKYFKTMLKGQKVTVWTDHLNLAHSHTEFTYDRVLHQRLLLEGYVVEINCIKEKQNIIADAMSSLPTYWFERN